MQLVQFRFLILAIAIIEFVVGVHETSPNRGLHQHSQQSKRAVKQQQQHQQYITRDELIEKLTNKSNDPLPHWQLLGLLDSYFDQFNFPQFPSQLQSQNETLDYQKIKRIENLNALTAFQGWPINLIKGVVGSDNRVGDDDYKCISTTFSHPWTKAVHHYMDNPSFIGMTSGPYPQKSHGHAYLIQQCTLSHNGEWHRNNLFQFVKDDPMDWYFSKDSLEFFSGTLKTLSTEWRGETCIKYLTISCGHKVTASLKAMNIIIPATFLAGIFGSRGWEVRQCGVDGRGFQSVPGAMVHFELDQRVFNDCFNDSKSPEQIQNCADSYFKTYEGTDGCADRGAVNKGRHDWYKL